MKFLLIFALFMLLAQAYATLTSIHEACVSKLNISAEVSDKYRAYDYAGLADTPCYFKCMFEEAGVLDDEKGFHKEELQIKLGSLISSHSEEVSNLVGECIDQNSEGAEICPKAEEIAQCIYQGIRGVLNSELKPY